MNPTETLFAAFDSEQDSYLKDFFSYLKFKSISTDPAFKSEVEECSKWVAQYLSDSGFEVEVWPTGGHPVVFAEWSNAGADKPTLLFYGHYDVQPVDPIDQWKSDPFDPSIKDGIIIARGASDNKGQSFYTMAALRHLLKRDGALPVNVKLVIEGEEECGSGGLFGILAEKKKKLQADSLLIVDVGLPDPETPAVTLGVRGILPVEVEVTGSNVDLHSGVHGGVVYNPNHALVEMLAGLRDSEGRVTVPGFYDNVRELSEDEKKQIWLDLDVLSYEAAIAAKATGGEKSCSPAESGMLRPTLEINGISGGYSGPGVKTVIPSKAIAKLTCRLVPDQNPQKIGKAIESHLKSAAPEGIAVKVTLHDGTPGYWATSDCTIAEVSREAYTDVFGKEAQYMYCGGTIPVVGGLVEASGADVALVGYWLVQDNVHAPNENFSLDRCRKGFVTIGRIVERLGQSRS